LDWVLKIKSWSVFFAQFFCWKYTERNHSALISVSQILQLKFQPRCQSPVR
jgi:hypothetical protein